jgi:DNA adenine methylase
VRYPGGKRRLMTFLWKYLPVAEAVEGRYVEPFVGSGAVFFRLRPRRALLSDVNQELIDLYRGIRYAPRKVWALYSSFGSTKEDYIYIRDVYRPKSLVERAARTLYLNRTCFKGMWRHNRLGNFNVGYGGQERRWTITEQILVSCASALRQAVLACGDFQTIVDCTERDDFIFLDPPYRPGYKEYWNSHYIWNQFRYSDYERLADSLQSAKSRGVHWAMTISSHEEILRLFRGNYALKLPRGTGKMPGILTSESGEVIITSYQIEGGKKL